MPHSQAWRFSESAELEKRASGGRSPHCCLGVPGQALPDVEGSSQTPKPVWARGQGSPVCPPSLRPRPRTRPLESFIRPRRPCLALPLGAPWTQRTLSPSTQSGPQSAEASASQQSQEPSSGVPASKASSWRRTCHEAGAACTEWGGGPARGCYRNTLPFPRETATGSCHCGPEKPTKTTGVQSQYHQGPGLSQAYQLCLSHSPRGPSVRGSLTPPESADPLSPP